MVSPCLLTFVSSERRLTCLRCSLLCVSVLPETYLPHPANKCPNIKRIVCFECCDPVVGRARPSQRPHRFDDFHLCKSSVSTSHGLLICLPQLVIFNSVSATLIARFILDLRSADTSMITPDPVSSVQFAADLAVPLGPDSTWVTGQSDDLENDPGHLDPCFDQSPEPAQPAQEAGEFSGVLLRSLCH